MTIDDIKISVIIPLYNQKKYIGQAVESVLSQTHKNIEVIVVDDGSTDNPELVLTSYGKQIIYFRQNNMGPSAARNSGIEISSGEYIQFLDADDYLHDDKLKNQLDFMIRNDEVVSYCEIAQYNHVKGKHFLRYIGEVDDAFESLFFTWKTYPFPIHSLLFNKNIFKNHRFPVNLKAAEDRYFLSILSLDGHVFKYFPYIGGGRRLHSNNMNKNRVHIYENMIKYYMELSKNKLAVKYIEGRSNDSIDIIMRDNISYLYLRDFENCVPRKTLKEISRILSKHSIDKCFSGLPFPDVPLKVFAIYSLALYRRICNSLVTKLVGRYI